MISNLIVHRADTMSSDVAIAALTIVLRRAVSRPVEGQRSDALKNNDAHTLGSLECKRGVIPKQNNIPVLVPVHRAEQPCSDLRINDARS